MRQRFQRKHYAGAALAAALLGGAGAANASLIFLGEIDLSGTGLGSVPTVLTLQSPANTTAEQGSVAWNGTTNVTSGDTIAINQTRTIAEAGATSASNLRIVVNATEPGNDNSVTLNSLVMTVFGPTGTSLFSANLLPAGDAQNPITLNPTRSGIGQTGFVFGLNAQEAAQAQTTAFAGAFQNNRIGLAAQFSNATGGPETLWVGNFGGSGGPGGLPPLVGPIPEPGTMALLATGLLAMGGIARRRTRS